MQYLVYLVFYTMIIIGLRYVSLPKSTVRNPFDKKRNITVTGPQHFVLFTFYTGIIMLADLSAERLMIWICLSILSLLIDRHQFIVKSPVVLCYVLYLLWLMISLFLTSQKFFGSRVFLKYLYPFLFMLLAAKLTVVPILYFRVLKNIFQLAIFACIYLLVLFNLFNRFLGFFFWNIAAIQDFMMIGITVALAYYTLYNQKKFLIYIVAFFACSVAWVNRTGLLASSITIMIYSVIRYKLKALPYIILALGLLIGIVLYVDTFREKMFNKGMSSEEILGQRESLSSENINSSGRFAMWEWSLDLFYKGHEWTGSGLGVLQQRFYSEDHPFMPLRVVHNDYVQILCDTGLIGLILYLCTFFSLVIHAVLVCWNTRKPVIVRVAAMVAGIAMGGMISTLYTDNVVNYSLLTLSYPFGLYGMFLGLNYHVRQ